MAKKQLWFVMGEYNDDKDPYFMFRSLRAVREHYHKKRLTKLYDGSYVFNNDSRKPLHVQTKEQAGLEMLQYYGYRDEEEYWAHYFSLADTWYHTDLHNSPNREMADILYKKHEGNVLPYEACQAWGRMMDRFNAVFAPIKPKSLEEIS
jgi:hypothetical protein